MRTKKDLASDAETKNQHLLSVLEGKADHKDLDLLGQKLHGKADADNIRVMQSDIRQDLLSQLTTMKKELLHKQTRRDEEVTNLRVDSENLRHKQESDLKSMMDKLHRLASQFDKEL